MFPGVTFANRRNLDGPPQELTITILGGNTVGSNTLGTAVDWERSLITLRGGYDAGAAAQIQDRNARLSVSGTTITATRAAAGADNLIIHITVTQYMPNTFKQAVQRGTVTLSGVATNTTAINAVDYPGKAELRFIGQSVAADANQDEGFLDFASNASVRGSKAVGGGATIIAFEVADWY